MGSESHPLSQKPAYVHTLLKYAWNLPVSWPLMTPFPLKSNREPGIPLNGPCATVWLKAPPGPPYLPVSCPLMTWSSLKSGGIASGPGSSFADGVAAQRFVGSVPMFSSVVLPFAATLFGKPSQSVSPAGTGHTGSVCPAFDQSGQLSESS